MSRYNGRRVIVNDQELYRETFRNRGVHFIRQFETPKMRYPTSEEIQQLDLMGHIWGLGDKLWKLAHKHYGDPTLWYIIAWFNKKPTDNHYQPGDVVYIPFPLEKIKKFLGL